MIAYSFAPKTHKFTGTKECQRDPLESQAQGRDVWLLPANCTFVEPLPAKDGFDRVWNGTAWEYQEIVPEPEPEPYVPTEKEKLEMELAQTEQALRDLDYIGVKIATGRATVDEYTAEIAKMTELANKVNELRDAIKAIDTGAESV